MSDRDSHVVAPETVLSPGSLRLADKVIVVTGAASGQGAAEARALVNEGASVIAVDINPVTESPGITPFVLDVSDPAGWDRLVAMAESVFGRVDGLINNGAVGSTTRVGEIPLEEWNRVFAVNVTGPMLGIQKLLPLMAPGSSIVNVCSTATITPHYKGAYTASKWALKGLSHVAALELGERGIRVNAVHPGFIATPIIDQLGQAFAEGHRSITPLGRLGKPQDLAGIMVFLMSEESAYISAADIVVDGGYSRDGAGVHQSKIAQRAQSVTA